MVGMRRFELPTPCPPGWCLFNYSNMLQTILVNLLVILILFLKIHNLFYVAYMIKRGRIAIGYYPDS
jgi:hypothetical protein